jgi:hypothetical protein
MTLEGISERIDNLMFIGIYCQIVQTAVIVFLLSILIKRIK